jgi:hypothetical protein
VDTQQKAGYERRTRRRPAQFATTAIVTATSRSFRSMDRRWRSLPKSAQTSMPSTSECRPGVCEIIRVGPLPPSQSCRITCVADACNVFLKLRAENEQICFDLIRTDLQLCLTFAAVAETAHSMGQREYAERSLAKAKKGYSDMRLFSQATRMTAEGEKELQSKFRQVRERLDGLQRLIQSRPPLH